MVKEKIKNKEKITLNFWKTNILTLENPPGDTLCFKIKITADPTKRCLHNEN